MEAPEQQEEAPLTIVKPLELAPSVNESVLPKKSRPVAKWIFSGSSVILSLCVTVFFWQRRSESGSKHDNNDIISVAFLGNSILYFNDLPRFFERLSYQQVNQGCCLHGGASIPSLVKEGSGMYPQFETENAILTEWHNETIHDYGACTVPQLLLGNDASLEDSKHIFSDDNTTGRDLNPCREDDAYRLYLLDKRQERPNWDYVVINDNTRNPSRNASRQASLATLQETYVPWLLETGATPVFLWTYAYIPSNGRDMTGLEDVANFTSLTGVGVREYSKLLEKYLPASQKPRIAPVGLAFLTIYEESPEIWKTLFHNADHLHASPSGTFLQGCIVHYTLFGRLPDISTIQTNDNVADLWKTARMMQHAWEQPNPFPALRDVQYLYSIAKRIANGHIPSTYIDYENGEVAYEG